MLGTLSTQEIMIGFSTAFSVTVAVRTMWASACFLAFFSYSGAMATLIKYLKENQRSPQTDDTERRRNPPLLFRLLSGMRKKRLIGQLVRPISVHILFTFIISSFIFQCVATSTGFMLDRWVRIILSVSWSLGILIASAYNSMTTLPLLKSRGGSAFARRIPEAAQVHAILECFLWDMMNSSRVMITYTLPAIFYVHYTNYSPVDPQSLPKSESPPTIGPTALGAMCGVAVAMIAVAIVTRTIKRRYSPRACFLDAFLLITNPQGTVVSPMTGKSRETTRSALAADIDPSAVWRFKVDRFLASVRPLIPSLGKALGGRDHPVVCVASNIMSDIEEYLTKPESLTPRMPIAVSRNLSDLCVTVLGLGTPESNKNAFYVKHHRISEGAKKGAVGPSPWNYFVQFATRISTIREIAGVLLLTGLSVCLLYRYGTEALNIVLKVLQDFFIG
jgi:hypothetical protein